MSCTKTHNPLNLVQLPHQPLVIPTCCHANIVTLTPLTTLMIITAPQNAATCAAALTVILVAMTIMMMINLVINPLVLILTTITLLTKVHQGACLMPQNCILMVQTKWNCILTHAQTLAIPFILTAIAYVKTLSLPLIALHLFMMMIWMSYLTLGEN